MSEQPTKPVCPYCGSEDISADAAVRWDIENQEWQTTNVFDKGKLCDNCGEEFSECEWVPA